MKTPIKSHKIGWFSISYHCSPPFNLLKLQQNNVSHTLQPMSRAAPLSILPQYESFDCDTIRARYCSPSVWSEIISRVVNGSYFQCVPNESLPKSYLGDRSCVRIHPCWTDSAAPQLLLSGVALLHSSICSINCLNAQLVSGSRPASSTRCGGDASRETAGPPVLPAEPLMVIRRAADRPRCCGSEEWVSKDGQGRRGERERDRGERGRESEAGPEADGRLYLLGFKNVLPTIWSLSCLSERLHVFQ